MNVNAIAKLFRDTLAARCDEPCTGVQNAIDKLATEFRDRRAMFEYMASSRFTSSDLHDLVMVWMHMRGGDPLKLATGRTGDQWLDLINRRVRDANGNAIGYDLGSHLEIEVRDERGYTTGFTKVTK